ncbi:DUF222 domain-containing protein [Janibacter sp. G1551]|uniref:HNH endonuclease signature motif containing protein n=1 Tax=Janibacter sp. G1551 TaxID=3420440 RepID=UPI003CFDD13F
MSTAALFPAPDGVAMPAAASPSAMGAGTGLRTAIARGHAAVDGILAALAVEAGAGMNAADQRETLRELERLTRRTEAARLRVIAAAERSRLPERTGFADTGAWVARQTMTNRATAAGDAATALALGEDCPAGGGPRAGEGGEPQSVNSGLPLVSGVGESGVAGRGLTGHAFDRGEISLSHAKVIVGALRDLPDSIDAGQRATCEAELLRLAVNRSPAQLRRLARRVLDQVEPDPAVVDAHEEALVASEEERAWENATFWTRDNHDGTMSGAFTVPWLAGITLKKVIDAMTAPRRHTDASGRALPVAADGRETVDWKGDQLDWRRRRGVAFAELLQRIPTDHLHDKVAATILVTTDLDVLRGKRAAVGHTDHADAVSAGELRRSACGAGAMPVILDGDSIPLDLGRERRCFTTSQRVALSATYTECAADGCDRPFAWCEVHHLTAWIDGGRTNLANAVPLCGHHHRAIDRNDTTHTVIREDHRVRIRFRRSLE